MEVVGAIASFVAIGQALAAAPKIIDALRSLVEVRQEFLDLLNEVELLNSFGKLIRERIDELSNDDSMPQPTLLRSVASDLALIVTQIEDLTRDCQAGWKKNGQFKIARLRWLKYRRRLAYLTEKAKKNREYLQLIFSFTSLCASTSNGKMILDIHTIVTTQTASQTVLPDPSQSMSQENRSSDTLQGSNDGTEVIDEDIITATSSISLATISNNPHRSASSSIARGLTQQILSSERPIQKIQPLVKVTATIRSCVGNCACQCHSPVFQNRPHSAILPVLGWLNGAYNSVLHFGPRRCDILTCRRSCSPVHLNIRFPLLFCSRVLEARLSISSIAGAGASLHLRIPRQLSGHEELWLEISSGKMEILRLRLSSREFSPIDHNGQANPLEFI
ncbi:hypothetical protein F4776DRAFT_500275 [Hypoxylon sp. NC0597]|nr:hypothetical protein F4776DRAFT_500275 [Hypoxylon sp. NC0597]